MSEDTPENEEPIKYRFRETEISEGSFQGQGQKFCGPEYSFASTVLQISHEIPSVDSPIETRPVVHKVSIAIILVCSDPLSLAGLQFPFARVLIIVQYLLQHLNFQHFNERFPELLFHFSVIHNTKQQSQSTLRSTAEQN